ncbi:serine/threonine-protein kinase [Kitasatospora sp. NPDC054939]
MDDGIQKKHGDADGPAENSTAGGGTGTDGGTDSLSKADRAEAVQEASQEAPQEAPQPVVEDERPWELPDYEHEQELGAGASGRVVRARHRETGTPVAIKYLHRSAGTPALREEAQVLARIDSPHVTRLYEYVEGARGSAIVMELVDGIALRGLLREEGATTPEAALVVLKGSLLGLAAAHAAGVVHRDYKPANVLVDSAGVSKLVDFGIAVPSGADRDVSGTPAYMAPEQWAGQPASPAADVYAATATFFECLTGARPFGGSTLAELAVQHTEAPIPAEQAPDAVRPLILAGLAKDPEARPEGAAALVGRLEEVAVAGYGPQWEEKGRRDLAALVALLALLLPGGGGAAGGGTSLAHTSVAGTDAPGGANGAAGSSGGAAPGTGAVTTPIRYSVPRKAARIGRRGKVLAGVTAGTVTLASLAGMALAGAADGDGRTVVGGASPTATTNLGAPTPADGPSATGSESAGPSPEASTDSASPSASPSASASSGSPSVGASPTGKTPKPTATAPGGGAPGTVAPPAPGGAAPGTPAPGTPTAPPSPTLGTATPTQTPTPTVRVTSVNVDSLSCWGRWSLTSNITVAADGAGSSGTLTVSWYQSAGGTSKKVIVGTEQVPITAGRVTLTRTHSFSGSTAAVWGVQVSTSPGALRTPRGSAEISSYLCDVPR